MALHPTIGLAGITIIWENSLLCGWTLCLSSNILRSSLMLSTFIHVQSSSSSFLRGLWGVGLVSDHHGKSSPKCFLQRLFFVKLCKIQSRKKGGLEKLFPFFVVGRERAHAFVFTAQYRLFSHLLQRSGTLLLLLLLLLFLLLLLSGSSSCV